MQEPVSVIRNALIKQNNMEDFFNRVVKYLDGLFALKEDFSINAFDTVFSSLDSTEFAQAMYTCILGYDDDKVIDSLEGLEDEKLIQYMRDLLCIYGPRMENYFFKQAQTYNIKSSDVGYRKMYGRYQICLEIDNFASQKISLYDDPNNILLLCTRLIHEVKEITAFTELDKEVKDKLKKEIKKI